jgi:phospholipid transport system substrate-binding protein
MFDSIFKNGSESRFGGLRGAKRLIAALAVIGVVAGAIAVGASASADTGDPMTVVKGLVNSALGVLRNNSMTLAEKRQKMRALVSDSFDYTEMSRSALGYHWRSLTPAQRADFTRLFTSFIQDSYLNKIQDYKGQDVEFDKWSMDYPGYAQVKTRIIQTNGGQPIPLNYMLRLENGQWKIYDVTVDAISIIANYRNQFNRVINDQGFPKLMADLRAKRDELASSLGEQVSN